MIYLQEPPQHFSALQQPAEALLKELFQQFLLILEEKKVIYSTLPKESQPGRAAVSVLLTMNLEGREVKAICRIMAQWPQAEKMLNFSIEFRVSSLAGRQLCNLPHRTRIELVSAIGELNKYLHQQQSSLTLSSNHLDSLMFTARAAFLTSEKKGEIKRALCGKMKGSLAEFLKCLGELNELDWLGSAGKPKEYQTLGQLLETLYAKKLKISVKHSQKHDKIVKSCLSLLVRRTAHHNAAINKLKQANQYRTSRTAAAVEPKLEPIANGISILRKERSNPSIQRRLADNLAKNEAVLANEDSISLKKVTFQLRKSFGPLRPHNHEPQITHYLSNNYKQSEIQYQQNLILKRCLTFTQGKNAPTNDSSNQSGQTDESNHKKSQAESGHESQHNFLMVNGNLKSPYIGKYYLDVAEGSIDTITKRTIFTRFEKGDLFTEVAYASHYDLYHYTFLEYLTIFEQLAEGIAFLHENRVVHRDIKPTNVLFQYHSRNRLLCKLIDFGSCFVLRESAKHLFNPKVFTTPKFNLTYREAAKRTGNQICEEFTQGQYETHELFDMYGIAKTVSFLLRHSHHESECLDTIINICKDSNPNLRFTPEQLLVVIRHIKLKLPIQKHSCELRS